MSSSFTHTFFFVEQINGLQGGPGCSSFDGAMMEVGPWRWDGKSEHDFWVKPGGWEEYSTIVYGQFCTWDTLPSFLMCEHSGSTCRDWFLIYKHRSLCSHYRYRRLICFARHLINGLICLSRLNNNLWNFLRIFIRFFRSTKPWMYVFLTSCLFVTQCMFERPTLQEKALQANGSHIMVGNSVTNFALLIYPWP